MSREVVAGIISDAHLDRHIWTRRPEISGDSMVAFNEIMEIFYRKEVPNIIAAGDLLDKKVQKDSTIPLYIARKMSEWDTFGGGDFVFIQGQHELIDSPNEPWFQVCGWAEHIHKKAIELGPFKVYGLDFQQHGVLQEELDNIPKGTDILVAHQVWLDVMGDYASPQGSFEDIPVVSRMITGDYHSASHRKTRGKDGQTLDVFIPGATHFRTIAEPDAHYVGILYDNGHIEDVRLSHNRVKVEFDFGGDEGDPLLTMAEMLELVRKQLDSAMEYAEGLNFPEEIVKPVFRIVYPYEYADQTGEISKLVGDKAHLFWKELPPPERNAEFVMRGEDLHGEALTLERCLPKVSEAHDLTDYEDRLSKRLLEADDPYEEGVKWLKEEVFAKPIEEEEVECSSNLQGSKTS